MRLMKRFGNPVIIKGLMCLGVLLLVRGPLWAQGTCVERAGSTRDAEASKGNAFFDVEETSLPMAAHRPSARRNVPKGRDPAVKSADWAVLGDDQKNFMGLE